MDRAFIKVGDVMSPAPQIIDGLASVRQALDIMSEKQLSALVIERRHEGDEYAVVNISDIAAKVVSLNPSLERTSVYEIMTKPALTLSAQMNIKYAVRLLARFGLSRALVTKDDQLIGIVSLRDMVVRYVDKVEGAE